MVPRGPTSLSLHMHAAANSHANPIVAPFCLSDLPERTGYADYSESVQLSGLSRNRHAGQRKLALTLIQFLTQVHAQQIAQGGKSAPVLVLYAGGSVPASLAALSFFPHDRIVCCDPSMEMTLPVTRRELGPRWRDIVAARVATVFSTPTYSKAVDALLDKQVMLVTGDAGRVTDSKCVWALGLSRAIDMELVFVSDIRRDVSGPSKERVIAEDMIQQARWVQRLGVERFSVKFRLPFAVTSETRALYLRLTPHVSMQTATQTPHKLPYLSGTCALQQYARPFSTELRLMGFQKPCVVWYDVHEIESLMAAFNAVHRGSTRFTPYAPVLLDGATSIPDHLVEQVARVMEGVDAKSASSGAVVAQNARFDAIGQACVVRDAVLTSGGGAAEFSAACVRWITQAIAQGSRSRAPSHTMRRAIAAAPNVLLSPACGTARDAADVVAPWAAVDVCACEAS